ncbi:MAG TPA: M14 family metallopeptidase [Blastocatellia bacterium]|nr:M14 family metallopeptidase [Blastocatellia bacterium]
MRLISAIVCFLLLLTDMKAGQEQPDLRSRAERTNYTETSRYADVMEFIARLQRLSDKVKVESFSVSEEGRPLPLVILSDPAASTPIAAAASGKPVVFIMANIHAGEVEGKEATQHLMRDIITGPLGSLLDKIVLLVAPIYNADGNEKIDIRNRTAQNGPPGGVGTRENAQKLDLNRDFMKLESAEAMGLITGVLNRWDPHVVIDLHTTNGSFHGYALTYAPSLNPNADRRIIEYARTKLFPSVTKTLKTKHKYNTYYYGNFADEKNPSNELPADKAGDPKAWATFDYRPRFGNNYVGLRNRLAILSEAYSYLDFRSRVDVTDKFVRAILDYIAARPAEIVNLIREADRHAINTGATFGNEEGFGVRFELKPSEKPVEILVGSVNRVMDPRTGKPRFEATPEARPVKMTEYGEFKATRRVKAPGAYLLKPEQRSFINMLLAHGIMVEATAQDEAFEVERYRVKEFTKSARAFQGHKEAKLTVTVEQAQEKFPAGSFIVSMRQPKAALIFYLLEPESDDGLVNWNFLDQQLESAAKANEPTVYPIYRMKMMPRAPRMVVKR